METLVLNPRQEPREEVFASGKVSPRLESLQGKTLGLFSNVKLNSAKLLEFIAEELSKDAQFEIIRGFYDASKLMPEDGWGDIDRCDAVLLANGDCGSCSSSGIANAIELERRGIPALLISTTPFFGVVETMAKLRGMPSIQWAVVDHPIGSLKDPELRSRAAAAADQFRKLVLAPVAATEAA